MDPDLELIFISLEDAVAAHDRAPDEVVRSAKTSPARRAQGMKRSDLRHPKLPEKGE
jgi:hypothetical protein